MNEDILKILEYAVYAPSGDNSQPWRFEVDGNKIFQYNMADADNIFLNFKQSGSYVSHGAVIENIVIAASNFGYRVDVALFPDKEEKDLVAVLEIQKDDSVKKDFSAQFIKERCTNRRYYFDKGIETEKINSLISIVKNMNFGNLRFVTSKEDVEEVGSASTLMEVIALRNELVHKLFFSGIVWTEEEHAEKKKGLYLKTLELPLPVQYLFRVIKNWNMMSLLNHVGLAEKAAQANAVTNSKSAAFGIITMKNTNSEDFVNTGRTMQRMWLKATEQGLALQPITGLLFLSHRVTANETGVLGSKHVEMIKEGMGTIRKVFSLGGEIPMFMFRLGYAEKPSAHSLRNKPNISFR